MRHLRALAFCVAIGAASGLLVGGTLARLAMRAVFLAERQARGFETAAGATVGEVTVGGTVGVYAVGVFVGLILGLSYWISRPFLPGDVRVRVTTFTVGAALLGTSLTLADGREDFAFAPPVTSILLVFLAFVLTALPVAALGERVAPVGRRAPRYVSGPLAAAVLVMLVVFAAAEVSAALDVIRVV